MSKTRIYEVAKELGMNSKELMEFLEKELNISVKSHMSTIEEETVQVIKDLIEEERQTKKEVKKQKEPSKEKSKSSEQVKITEKPKEEPVEEKLLREVTLPSHDLTLDILAKQIGLEQNDIIKDMFMKGIVLKPGQKLDKNLAENIAMSYNVILNFEIEKKETEEGKEQDIEAILAKKWNDIYEKEKDKLAPRPPVVTIMGHVDHGKTTLLDKIRNTHVADKEEGGITQSIGAYQIEYNGQRITFIDTPGHEAFTEMRARGAQVTDIVVLIIAADDGVMPQTIEAYNHAKSANVPIIVAINKIDKPNANVELTKQQMVSKLNLIPEDWGGDTITVLVSAKTGEGIDELLEMILLESEMQEIRCIPDGKARAVIIESRVDKAMGPLGTVIVKDGILKVGDDFISGSTYGRVRRLINDKGESLIRAVPSTPVQVLGFNDVPNTHSILYVIDSKEEARGLAEKIKEKEEEKSKGPAKRHVKLEDIMQKMEEEEKKKLNILLKASTYGEIEALRNAIQKFENPEINIEIIHAGIGPVSTSDIMLASASDAIVLGFRVKADSKALKMAEAEGIEVRRYNIIFDLIDDIKKALEGMLEPIQKEELTGNGVIKEEFKIKGVGKIAGVQVNEGYVQRDGGVRIYRNGGLIADVKIKSLKHYKDEVKSIEAPKECGIQFENFEDFTKGDELEFYKHVFVKRELGLEQKTK
ncbi:translation initiation factor IF-2 [Petrotoga sp. HKA.pet.4.5]|uniref:translation initiation factor IF-2 n=1 Tax=unclassified Petrotoga TaxID=2620614 RepID=UPI000EF13788|nr:MULTISPECIES: translation initiation factor IF-2 [unclassified Petrotoga]RLL83995.1 translation initiation factor IF-2 [Petrotoga sp. Shatin.DS.tank11.9.2.9.3]RLL90381.1 translation initiation factor IF-2 [Petrotoga sp. HKA.pet.4.5]